VGSPSGAVLALGLGRGVGGKGARRQGTFVPIKHPLVDAGGTVDPFALQTRSGKAQCAPDPACAEVSWSKCVSPLQPAKGHELNGDRGVTRHAGRRQASQFIAFGLRWFLGEKSATHVRANRGRIRVVSELRENDRAPCGRPRRLLSLGCPA